MIEIVQRSCREKIKIRLTRKTMHGAKVNIHYLPFGSVTRTIRTTVLMPLDPPLKSLWIHYPIEHSWNCTAGGHVNSTEKDLHVHLLSTWTSRHSAFLT